VKGSADRTRPTRCCTDIALGLWCQSDRSGVGQIVGTASLVPVAAPQRVRLIALDRPDRPELNAPSRCVGESALSSGRQASALSSHQLPIRHPVRLIGIRSLPLLRIFDIRTENPLELRTPKCGFDGIGVILLGGTAAGRVVRLWHEHAFVTMPLVTGLDRRRGDTIRKPGRYVCPSCPHRRALRSSACRRPDRGRCHVNAHVRARPDRRRGRLHPGAWLARQLASAHSYDGHRRALSRR
jgi:hypothetical protein